MRLCGVFGVNWEQCRLLEVDTEGQGRLLRVVGGCGGLSSCQGLSTIDEGE